MSESKAPYNANTTATAGVFQPIDTNTISGVKCIRVTSARSLPKRMVDKLERMQGPHPRMAIVFWTGNGYQLRLTDPPEWFSVEE